MNTEFRRTNPGFSLCGLNCALCPRRWTDGKSQCPGCGGEGFSEKHPTCAVATCSSKHGQVEHCFSCESYPCARYADSGKRDSFITYRNVLTDMARAGRDLEAYHRELSRRAEILSELISSFDDGRRKAFFCLAVNLLPLPELEKAVAEARATKSSDRKGRAAAMVLALEGAATRCGVELRLRK